MFDHDSEEEDDNSQSDTRSNPGSEVKTAKAQMTTVNYEMTGQKSGNNDSVATDLRLSQNLQGGALNKNVLIVGMQQDQEQED